MTFCNLLYYHNYYYSHVDDYVKRVCELTKGGLAMSQRMQTSFINALLGIQCNHSG